MTARVRLALVLLALPACLEVPSKPAPECTTSTQCDTARGEVCEDGTCWGNPPTGELAFVVSPPAEHPELVAREIANARIEQDGRINALTFEQTASVTGRLDATCTGMQSCDRTMVSATVTVTRASLFPGGPGFKASATTMVSASENEGPTFKLRVPAGNGEPYVVTVLPQPRGDEPTATPSLAEIVPPRRTVMEITGAQAKTITLAAAGLPTVEGTLLAANGGGLARYRVVALGRWEADTAPTEVSTIAYTTSTGAFRLVLAADLVEPVEIVARPSDPLDTSPTLHLLDVPASLAAARVLEQPANIGLATTVQIRVTGRDGSGAPKSIAGARVRVRARAEGTPGGFAEINAEGTTDDSGSVALSLLDGAAFADRYVLDIVPPADAIFGLVYAQPFSLAATTDIELPDRTRVRGKVRDAQGEELAGVTVTARPSLGFAWNLPPAAQGFLGDITVSTAVTNADGEYVLWVDPALDGIAGIYDLALDPTHTSGALTRTPTSVQAGVLIPPLTSVSMLTVPDVQLPDAAFVHGPVLDPVGAPVGNAEVKVYRLSSAATALCATTAHPPVPCPAIAQLLGRAASDPTGTVELTLPR